MCCECSHGENPHGSSRFEESTIVMDIKVGEYIVLHQPRSTMYSSSADADIGEGGVPIGASLIESKVVRVNDDPVDLFIETENFVSVGSFTENEFSDFMLYRDEGGVLHADPERD